MPTIEEKYQHMRDNAEAFVESMRASVAAAEQRGDEELASRLRVWALNPWEAALRDDDSGDLWPLCEVCGEPIKDDALRVADEEGCNFHHACAVQ
ncbi:MAG: hypothetical protein EPN91_05760 [Salinibacterium sp.]|nr:MAG: hypothetical protein EPN91_05760 [Salinibacterium sp.]